MAKNDEDEDDIWEDDEDEEEPTDDKKVIRRSMPSEEEPKKVKVPVAKAIKPEIKSERIESQGTDYSLVDVTTQTTKMIQDNNSEKVLSLEEAVVEILNLQKRILKAVG